MNMQKKLEQAERLLNEVKEEMAKTAEVESWPQPGDDYWVPSISGGVQFYSFCNSISDKRYFELGLAFKSKEEAEAEIEARRVIYELKQQPGVVKFTLGTTQWTIAVDARDHQVFSELWDSFYSLQNSVWFESEETARAAIEAVGKDRILKAARWWAMGEI